VFTPDHLKKVALIETISWSLLLAAMVLEWISGWHGGIAIMGPIHGVLTVALLLVALAVTVSLKWPMSRFIKIMLASLIPVWGYLWIHRATDDAVSQPTALRTSPATE
jgi:integral membrane protein